jgi:hypothetical protein
VRATHILHYRWRKGGPYLWDASTPERQQAAYLALFRLMHSLEFYSDLEDTPTLPFPAKRETRQREWYTKAVDGDWRAAKHLLEARQLAGYEYETDWGIVEVLQPSARQDSRKKSPAP